MEEILANFEIIYSQVYEIVLRRPHERETHTIQLSVKDFMQILDERDEQIKEFLRRRSYAQRLQLGPKVNNEISKNHRIRVHLWKYQICRWMTEREEDWKKYFKLAKAEQEIISKFFLKLDPIPQMRPEFDRSGNSLRCYNCVTVGEIELKFELAYDEDLIGELKQIEDGIYELAQSWAIPERRPSPAPYY